MFDNYNSTLGGLQWESRNSQWQRADRGAAGLWSRAPVESVKTQWSSREWTAHSQLEVRWKHLFSLRKALNTILLFLLLWENAIYFWQKCCYCSILARSARLAAASSSWPSPELATITSWLLPKLHLQHLSCQRTLVEPSILRLAEML